MEPSVKVALLGAGTVGTAVARLLQQRSELLAARVGRPLELTGIAVRSLDRPRALGGTLDGLLTDRPEALVDGADVVVEVMGGIEPAKGLIERALGNGSHVVTANKQIIARHGAQLHALADRQGVGLDYEAAVVAAVPVLRVVREALAGDEITGIAGILNGSTNYILDMVGRHGMAVEEAITRAGELGFLEADPAEDLEGLDAAAKIVILARTAFGCDVRLDDVQREGITGLTDADFETARGTGHVIKLIASAWRTGSPQQPHVKVAVRPVSLSADDPLAMTREGGNMVVIEAESAGSLRLQGAGAGGEETASAVLGDLVGAARRVVASVAGPVRR